MYQDNLGAKCKKNNSLFESYIVKHSRGGYYINRFQPDELIC